VVDGRGVAVLHLGRASAKGEGRRVASWVRLFEAAGARVDTVPLLERSVDLPHMRSLPGRALAVGAARAVPEALAWSHPSLTRRLHALVPDLVVAVTGRAFDPAVAARWPTVVDLVDRLSVSYRDRAPHAAGPARRVGYRGLAWTAARFERNAVGGTRGAIATVAAGYADAESLAVEWVPNVVEGTAVTSEKSSPDVDVLFFGTLSYPPNIEAVERLARVWPALLAARPGTTALVAGASPSAAVQHHAGRLGWRVEPDFADLAAITARCRVAVAPLVHASGIQNKLLDAAALGLAQVVSPAALAGLAPGFPAVVAPDDDAFVAGVVELLESPGRRRQLAADADAHVRDVYGVERWVPWARRVLGG
jgi:hypothetical protein